MRTRALLLCLLAFPSVRCAAAPHPVIPPVAITAAPTSSEPSRSASVVPFIEDDFPKALAEAKAAGLPLFVDAWAPWCHTCLSMRSYVFTDESLRPLAARYVWLALDTEKPENAAFVDRFPMHFWPTLWVIDPKTEQAVLRWLGSATAKELASLLLDASSGSSAGPDEMQASAALLRGERATAAGKREEAIASYRAALASAPPRWAKRARVDEALVSELWATRDDAACAALADAEMAKIPPGTSLANVGLFGLQCARRAPVGSATRSLAPRLARAVEQLALDPGVPMLDDDRSGLFEEVVDDRDQDHDAAGAKALAESWAAMLDARARDAKTAAARAVFDAHRVLAYVALGDPARALPMLAESEKAFPDDYNPPARIARVDLELKRFDDALAAIRRALSKGYGPRKLKLFLLEVDVLTAMGDVAGARRAIDEALSFADMVPAGERPESVIAELRKRRSPTP